MDVDEQASHGAGALLSMLDFDLSAHYNAEETLILYCDNCGGQNKNRFLIGYCADLVKNKRYKKVEVHFLPGDPEVDWPWRNYKAYLEPRYDAVKGIQGSNHFCLTISPNKGVTLTYSYAEGHDEEQIWFEYVHKQRKGKASEEPDEHARKNPVPAVIPVAGLSETRKIQLIKDTAHHVSFNKKTAFISYILSIAARKAARPTKQ